MIPRWNNEVYPVIFSSDGFKSSAIEAICSTYNDAKRYVVKLESELTEDEIADGCEFKIVMFNLIECGEIVDSKILE